MKKDRFVKYRFFIIDVDKEQRFIDDYREKGYRLEAYQRVTYEWNTLL